MGDLQVHVFGVGLSLLPALCALGQALLVGSDRNTVASAMTFSLICW